MMPKAISVSLAILALFLTVAPPAAASDYVRVYTFGRNSEGKLMRVMNQPVYLWKDSAKVREGLKAGIQAIRSDESLSLDANDQLKLLFKQMPKPDVTSNTDLNGEVLLDNVDVFARYLVIVQNKAPYHQGGGPYVGLKAPGSRKVRCTGEDLNGLISFLERYQLRPL